VAGYRADIEIGVKGLRDLQSFRREVDLLSQGITGVNKGLGGAAQSIDTYNKNLQAAARNLNEVNAGTITERDAVRQYVRALGEANTARERQNRLISEQIEAQRRARLAAGGIRETTQFAGPIGPGPASPIGALVGQKSPVEERIRRTIAARREEADLQTALLRLEERSAQEVNKKVQAQEALVAGTREVYELIVRTNREQQFLAGRSGSALQGPLQGLAPNPVLASSRSATGFPVALPLTQAEEKTLQILRKRQEVLDRIVKQRQDLQTLAGNLQRLENQTTVAIADANREQQQLTQAKERSLKVTERELQISKQSALLAGRFSPIGGREDIPGSPAALRKRSAQRREALSNAVIGGAFPLLFGQGLGAAAGGGLGGAAGGLAGGQFGFGLSLVGTAIGSAIDTLISKTADLGRAVNPATADLGALTEAIGITGTSTKKYIDSLIEQGRTQDALLFTQNELNRIVGSEGVANLSRYGEAVVQLNNEWAKLFAEVGAGLAGLFAGPTKSFADALERDRLVRQAQREGNITPEQQRGLRPTFETFSGSAASNELLQKTLNEIAAKQKQINKQQAEAEKKALDKNQVEAQAVSIKLKQVDAGYAEIEALEAGNNLLDDKVFKAKEAAIAAEFEVASAQELIDKGTDFNSRLARRKSLYELNAERARQEAQALEKSAREAERLAGSLAKLQTGLIQESLKAADADVQIVKIRQGTSAANRQELSQLVARQALEEKILFINAQQQISQKDLTEREKELVNATYVQQLRNLRSQYDVRKQTLVQLEAARRLSKFTADQEAQQQIQNTLDSFRLAREEEVQFGKTYFKLVSEGLLPVEAERLANFEKVIENEKRSLDSQIVLVEAALQRADLEGVVGDELQKQIDKLERLKKLRGELDKPTDPGEGPTNIERLEGAIANAKGQLNELTDTTNIVKGAAESVGAAFAQSFTSIISGTQSAQEALSDFFKNIGDFFLETAEKIIAKLIEIFILEQLVGFIGGAFGGATGKQTSADFALFAEGGYVTSPTRAIIGEGGEPEYVIPFSKMGSAAANFAAGARGEDVFGPLRSTSVPFSKTTERMMSERSERETVAALNNPDPLDVRFNSQVINNVEYVTAEEYRKGMTEAAERGRTLTLAALQNSVKTRKRVGIG
jgi:hypothetical protein